MCFFLIPRILEWVNPEKALRGKVQKKRNLLHFIVKKNFICKMCKNRQ